MIQKIDNDVKQILNSASTKLFHLMKIPNISDEMYDKLVIAITSIGGTWSERHRGFLFGYDPTENLKKLREKGEYHLSDEAIWKEKVQFFPTPTSIAKKMVDMAELKPGDVVLEPSAGHGSILDLLPNYIENIAVEFDESNFRILHDKGYNVLCGDFLSVNNITYNKVIMNPPFSNSQDVVHIMHAYDMLQKGGILVSIVNENSLYRKNNNDKCKQFADLLRTNEHEIIYLPEGAFSESGTMINTVIVKIKK